MSSKIAKRQSIRAPVDVHIFYMFFASS